MPFALPKSLISSTSLRRAMLPLLILCAAAGSAGADKLDDLVQAEMKRQHIPGLSLAVVKNGKVIKEKGYGLANVEHKIAVKPQTIFQSGSIGKQFTAALVMLLVQDGKIALDDPISKYLEGTPKAWEKITVRHLLTHTSGLADPYEKLDFRKDYTDAELLKVEADIPLLFAPGEKWAYSNTGYHVLGFLCNKVGGKFYGDQLAERIFKPIGMKTAIINERNIVPHRAAGYDLEKGELKNQQWVSPMLNTTADGSLYLTAHDLALWDLALYDNQPLSAALKQQSWTPVKLNDGKTHPYGFGWGLEERNGHRNIAHGGAWQGFTTYISRFPDDKLSVVVLTNVSGVRPGKVADQVAAHYLPALAVQPAKPIEDTEPAVTQQVRGMILKLVEGSLTPEMFSEKLAERLFPAWVKGAGAELHGLGPLRNLELLERSVDGENRLYRYRAVFPKGSELVRLVYDKAGKIDRMAFITE